MFVDPRDPPSFRYWTAKVCRQADAVEYAEAQRDQVEDDADARRVLAAWSDEAEDEAENRDGDDGAAVQTKADNPQHSAVEVICYGTAVVIEEIS